MVENDRVEKDHKCDIKLVDFGLAKVKPKAKNFRDNGVGTRYYMAPELFEDVKHGGSGHGAEVDIWAVGVICF